MSDAGLTDLLLNPLSLFVDVMLLVEPNGWEVLTR